MEGSQSRGHTLSFDPRGGESSLAEVSDAAKRLGPVIPLGIGPCVLTLGTLNELDCPEVRTPWATEHTRVFSTAWREIVSLIRAPRPPSVAVQEASDRITAQTYRAYEPLPPKGKKQNRQ
jgi:hypothetical protein